jgi:putative SOS response-associated peptidase YedK
MCGRFTVTQPDPAQITQQFHLTALPAQIAAALHPRYNIAPTQPVLAVSQNAQGENELSFMHWGLIPSWSKDVTIASKMINARSETLAEKPSFRVAFSKRRCLILADGFYEWKTDPDQRKSPYRITLQNGELFAFAGLYEYWTEPSGGLKITSCTLITTEPNALMATIHHRMPVILNPEQYGQWLDYQTTDSKKVAPLLTQYPADQMRLYPVSREVNQARNDHAGLVQPLN